MEEEEEEATEEPPVEEDEVETGAELIGRIFDDADGSRVWNDEDGIAGVVVTLYLDDGDLAFDAALDTFIAQQTVDATGAYLFTDLEPGNYWVWVDESTLPEFYVDTFTLGDHGVQNPGLAVIAAEEETPVGGTLESATASITVGPDFAYAQDTDGDSSPG